jgi:hypothetical protein
MTEWRPLFVFHGTKYDTIVSLPKIVIDTNVLLSALRSNRGASHKLLKMIPEKNLPFVYLQH